MLCVVLLRYVGGLFIQCGPQVDKESTRKCNIIEGPTFDLFCHTYETSVIFFKVAGSIPYISFTRLCNRICFFQCKKIYSTDINTGFI